MSVLLVVAAAVISIMLGRDIYKVMDIQESQSDSETSFGSGRELFQSSNLELRSRFRDIALSIGSLLVIYLIALIWQTQIISQSDIDFTYRFL
ncbi:hypothetical protein B2I21_31800 [Chryseobacterium mucoviscidosis]|nr:hypothetical protein B2I21_31800 [Chryseobacterium mucoviscidosis]